MTLPASPLSPEAALRGAFHGVPQTDTVKEEQPYHRQAALMLALGADSREVANALGVTTAAVRGWFKNAWFQARVNEFIEKHTDGKDITQLFLAEAFPTLAVMLDIRDDPKVSKTVKAGICRDILDRGLGKPTQYVKTESKNAVVADPVAEALRLEAENVRFLNQNN